MVNCCTLSTNSVLIKCAKGMGGGGCVVGFFSLTVIGCFGFCVPWEVGGSLRVFQFPPM